ncbi:DUF3106 domain-containing protein [Granulicella arctica]|uniref:DUF3106 domain-containing protein n=1 Tax=Granulicella arctica TaxID=940613 RepID=UPI0021DFCB78|nr:DUF3106 domain-containing protein [Granulicella arctica]
MAFFPPYRFARPAPRHIALVLTCALIFGTTSHAEPPGQSRPNFGQRPPAMNGRQPRAQQEHLAQWMDRHSNLPLNQQQQALESEPGFRDLPPQTQQRMRDRLIQLNNMPLDRRRRLLERTEEMEQLSPQQRQQVRGAMQQLSNLPVDRRRLVARAFRDIREMPVPQRQVVLNSDRLRSQFSDQERGTLGNLLAVEPYLPTQHTNEPPDIR